MMSDISIYSLIDPRNNDPFYIGQTNNPRRRLWQHRKEQKYVMEYGISINFKYFEMFNMYRETGQLVTMQVLELVPVDDASWKEVEWIKRYLGYGYELLNVRMNRNNYQSDGIRDIYPPIHNAYQSMRTAESSHEYVSAAYMWESVAFSHSHLSYILKNAAEKAVYCWERSRVQTAVLNMMGAA